MVDIETVLILLDEEQRQIVSDYVMTINSSIIEEYFKRMYATFGDCLKIPRVPLPTTCARKIIEKPDIMDSSTCHVL